MSKVIGIVSGKGGVGKTTICAGLAFALASRGKKVIAIDGDIGLKNLDILLGLVDKSAFDIMDILSGRCTINKAIQVHDTYPKLHFISASQSVSAESIDKKAFRKLCEYLRDHYNYILIDAPAGIGAGFDNVIGCCDECIVVVTPDYTSQRDAQKLSTLIADMPDITPRLVINKINIKMMKKGFLKSIDEMIDGISIPLLGMLPSDDNVILCSNDGTPVIESKKSKLKGPMLNIADRIIGNNVPLDKCWRK